MVGEGRGKASDFRSVWAKVPGEKRKKKCGQSCGGTGVGNAILGKDDGYRESLDI